MTRTVEAYYTGNPALRSPKWQRRRLQILELDNWRCSVLVPDRRWRAENVE